MILPQSVNGALDMYGKEAVVSFPTLQDHLKALIFADFCEALQAVRDGQDPDEACQAHERRVAPLRRIVENIEATQNPSQISRRTHLRLVS